MAGMMTGLLLLLLVGVTVGRVVDLHKRIYGGKTCAATDRLYHVKLIRYAGTNNERHLCGGSLISKDWILTAGHCVPKASTTRVTAFLRVHQDGEQKQVDIEIKNIVRYYGNNNILTHDIALLKLPTSETGYEIVSLPDCSKPRPQKGKTVQIAGHGLTEENSVSRTLQCAETEVDDCVECDAQPHQWFDPRKIFCFKKDGVDTRDGDSGGGVVYNCMIYGVFIRSGVLPCDKPGRVMDVCKYQEWIEQEASVRFPNKLIEREIGHVISD